MSLQNKIMETENELKGVQGACLCGSVRFEVKGKINKFCFCHCLRCRRSTGSAHASNIFMEPKDIKWLTGEEKIKRYDLPEADRFSKQFCSDCGSLVPHVSRDRKRLSIPAGTLEQNIDANPQKNIFWDSKAKWYESGLDAPRCMEYE